MPALSNGSRVGHQSGFLSWAAESDPPAIHINSILIQSNFQPSAFLLQACSLYSSQELHCKGVAHMAEGINRFRLQVRYMCTAYVHM